MNTKTRLSILFLLMVFVNFNTIVAQEIGLQLYSLREQFKKDVPKTLELISSWGITKIEGGENTYGVPEDEFIALLDKNNLEIISIGVSFNKLKANPEKEVEKAKKFGAKYAMCPWITHDGDNFTIKDAKNATNVFNKAGKLFKQAGITLVYHPHGYEFRLCKEGTLFDYMAKKAKNFCFEMDVYWVKHGGADPIGLLNKYPTKFLLMHLKDMKKGLIGDNTGHSDVETNVVLGAGQIDIASIVKRGKELGINYMFIEDESSSVVTQVPESLKYLKNIKH